MGNKISLDEQLIDLRITSKQMQRSAKKCEKNQQANIEKLKKVRCGYVSILMFGRLIRANEILMYCYCF
jgi:hypothetical protein